GRTKALRPSSPGRYSHRAATTTSSSAGMPTTRRENRPEPLARSVGTTSVGALPGRDTVSAAVAPALCRTPASGCSDTRIARLPGEVGTDPGTGVGELGRLYHREVSVAGQRYIDDIEDPTR